MLICLLEDGPRCQRKLIHIYEHDAKGKHCFGYRRRYKNRQLRARGFLSPGDAEQHHSPSVVEGTLSTIMREGTLRSNEKTSKSKYTRAASMLAGERLRKTIYDEGVICFA